MKTIRVACKGSHLVSLDELTILQGDLKNLTEENYEKLKSRILERGYSFPIFWYQDQSGTKWILDGTHRKLVLIKLREEGYEIPKLPTCQIEARDIKEAKAKLLEVTSSYADITAEGLTTFTADLDLESLKDGLKLPDFNMSLLDIEVEQIPDEVEKPKESSKKTCPQCGHEF